MAMQHTATEGGGAQRTDVDAARDAAARAAERFRQAARGTVGPRVTPTDPGTGAGTGDTGAGTGDTGAGTTGKGDPTGYDTRTQSRGGGGYGSRGTGSTGDKGDKAPKFNLPKAKDYRDYIRRMYDQQRQAQRAQLRSAYQQQMADMDYQAGQIPETYNAAANQTAAQAEINKLNMNNMAAGTGINTGAYGQQALSQANALQRDITAVRQAEADAQEQLALERQKQTAAYKQAIAQAIAENNRARAEALYQEAVRQDQAAQQRAQAMAQYRYNVWATRQQRR